MLDSIKECFYNRYDSYSDSFFRFGSLFQDPLLKVHEIWRRRSIAHIESPSNSLIHQYAHQAFLNLQIAFYFSLACFTSLPSIGFTLTSNDKDFTRIYTTHMQHSEETSYPTREEIKSRKKQSNLIKDEIRNSSPELPVFLIGDFNMNANEFNDNFAEFLQMQNQYSGYTWGGDQYSVQKIVKGDKRYSTSCNLDYTGLVKAHSKHVESFQTTSEDVEFDGTQFYPYALSDHQPLLTKVELK